MGKGTKVTEEYCRAITLRSISFHGSWESGFQLVSLLYKYCGSYVHSQATRAKSYLHQTFPNVNYCANRLSAGQQYLHTNACQPLQTRYSNTAQTLLTSSRSVIQLGTRKCRRFVLPGCSVPTHHSPVIKLL